MVLVGSLSGGGGGVDSTCSEPFQAMICTDSFFPELNIIPGQACSSQILYLSNSTKITTNIETPILSNHSFQSFDILQAYIERMGDEGGVGVTQPQTISQVGAHQSLFKL